MPKRKQPRKRKTWILSLDKDDPERELDFEVRFRLSLSRAQRFLRMWNGSLQIAHVLKAYGHKKGPRVTQRA